MGICRVMLCGRDKKPVASPVYLHELGKIIRKTGADQFRDRPERDAEGTQHFFPSQEVGPADRLYIVFINGRVGFTDI